MKVSLQLVSQGRKGAFLLEPFFLQVSSIFQILRKVLLLLLAILILKNILKTS